MAAVIIPETGPTLSCVSELPPRSDVPCSTCGPDYVYEQIPGLDLPGDAHCARCGHDVMGDEDDEPEHRPVLGYLLVAVCAVVGVGAALASMLFKT